MIPFPSHLTNLKAICEGSKHLGHCLSEASATSYGVLKYSKDCSKNQSIENRRCDYWDYLITISVISKIVRILVATVGKYEVVCMWFGLLNFTLLSLLKRWLEKFFFSCLKTMLEWK